MTLIYCSVQGVNYAAAAFALVAAVLWFVSASVKTPSSFDINFEISVSSYDGSAGGTGYSLGLSNLRRSPEKPKPVERLCCCMRRRRGYSHGACPHHSQFMLRAPGGLSCRQVLHWPNLPHSQVTGVDGRGRYVVIPAWLERDVG